MIPVFVTPRFGMGQKDMMLLRDTLPIKLFITGLDDFLLDLPNTGGWDLVRETTSGGMKQISRCNCLCKELTFLFEVAKCFISPKAEANLHYLLVSGRTRYIIGQKDNTALMIDIETDRADRDKHQRDYTIRFIW